MMEINVLQHNSMASNGSYLLRSIQNETLTGIDLLIRECLQNSLDAGLRGQDEVIVNTILKSCNRKELSKVFTGLTKELDKRYPQNTVQFIALRDSNTTGLTGPLKESELADGNEFGNLRKLVYEFGQAQEGTGKGGSWGVGKTVQFRIGIGLVVYYSRIKREDGDYESRLAAALIEDNKSPKSLIKAAGLQNGKLSQGIAWWGDNEEDEYGNKIPMPITNEREIKKIIDIFEGVKPYIDTETGTCLIIPYIEETALRKQANPAGTLNGKLEDYIKLAVQRWYLPRLDNKEYRYGPNLKFLINNMPLRLTEKRIFFTIMQKLYNLSTTYLMGDISLPSGYYAEPIKIRGDLEESQLAGVVVYTKVTDTDLQMAPPNNEPSPYRLLNRDEEDDDKGNTAIIAYCREAGMVINYEIISAWTQGIPMQPEGEFLLAFFQPNGKQHLKACPGMTLDEYLRSTENADHHAWQDRDINGSRINIIEKIVRNIPKKIAGAIDDDSAADIRSSDKLLQKMLGKAFLPPTGYGIRVGKDNNSGVKTTGSGSGNIIAKMQAPVYQKNGTLLAAYELHLKNKVKVVDVFLKAHTTQTEITADQWEKDIGTKFPAEILINGVELVCNDEEVHPIYLKSHDHGVCYGIRVDVSKLNKGKKRLRGQIPFVCHDNTLSIRLLANDVSEKAGEFTE